MKKIIKYTFISLLLLFAIFLFLGPKCHSTDEYCIEEKSYNGKDRSPLIIP